MFTHIIYAILLWQLVNKTADCFNNIVFIFVVKISSKKVCENMENNSTLEKVLLVCNRNVELLRLVGATFDAKVASLRRMRKKNLIILKSLQKKSLPFFVLFVYRCWHFVICNMLTERTYYYNNLHFYWSINNWNFIWNIDLNNGVYCDLRHRSACLNTV